MKKLKKMTFGVAMQTLIKTDARYEDMRSVVTGKDLTRPLIHMSAEELDGKWVIEARPEKCKFCGEEHKVPPKTKRPNPYAGRNDYPLDGYDDCTSDVYGDYLYSPI